MSNSPKIAPYGSWKSPITADLIVHGSVGLGQPTFDDLTASVDVGPDSLRAALSGLCCRRLIMSTAGRYTAVGRGNWIE